MTKASLFIVAAVIGLSACKPAEHEAAKVDVAAEEQAIRAKETAWMAAYNKHDGKELASQYEDDASLAANGTKLMTDSVGRGLFLDGMASDPALKVDFASDRIIVAASGDLASSRGHYTFTYTDPVTKQPKAEEGNYLTVYRKAADGSWKAIEDFTTPGPAPVPATPAQ
jgi:ketosteroid isomerase-like protein